VVGLTGWILLRGSIDTRPNEPVARLLV
jgi:hypothetical protein